MQLRNKQQKKRLRLPAFLLCLLSVLSMYGGTAEAASATSYTLTLDRRGSLVRTQDAYLPDMTVLHLGLSSAEDLFFNEADELYIADTGNRRIAVYDPGADAIVREITHEEFQTPRGVFVSVTNEVYVADTNAGAIFVFTEEGELIRSIDSVESPSFTREFRPLKVSVDVAGNIYTLGEGIYDGIIQLSNAGEFLGYFTSNRVNLTFTQMLQDFFFTEAQLANLFSRTPQTFSNLFTDRNGILYTATIGGQTRHAVKKHNTAGQNMLNPTIPVAGVLDIYVDDDGIMYAATSEGYIYVFSSEGEFIYLFGSQVADVDIAGIFESLRSLAVDSQGVIWTLDIEKGMLQSFRPTDYSERIYSALGAYNSGDYDEAIVDWNEALRLNQMSVLAHNNIARNYFSQQDYEASMYHAEIAGNRFYYSEAFWEIRNSWLQDNIALMMTSLFVLAVGYFVLKRVNRRTAFLAPVQGALRKAGENRLIANILFVFPVMRHPVDNYYEMKKRRRGSLTGALIIYLLFFAVLVFSIIGAAFMHRQVDISEFSLPRVAFIYFGLSLLFVVCNYLVTSLQDGEGSLTDIFKVVAYSLGPILIGLFVNTVLSYIVTENEVFLLDFAQTALIIWSLILLFIGLQEIHVYEPGETLGSILISLAFMLIIGLVGTLFFVMGEMLVQFFIAIIQEGALHAF